MQFDNTIRRYIIYNYIIYVLIIRDKIISENYKYINLILLNSFLVIFFSLKL